MRKTAPKVEDTTDFYDYTKAVQQPSYNSLALLETIKAEMNLKNDAALARLLKFNPSVISKLRHNTLPVTPLILLRVVEATGWTTKKARAALGA